jgi:hypothetical protein
MRNYFVLYDDLNLFTFPRAEGLLLKFGNDEEKLNFDAVIATTSKRIQTPGDFPVHLFIFGYNICYMIRCFIACSTIVNGKMAANILTSKLFRNIN